MALETAQPSAGSGIRFGLRFKFLLLVSFLFMFLISGLAYYLVRNGAVTLRANLQRESRSFATLASGAIGESFVLYKDSGTSRIDQQVNSSASLDSVISNISIVGLDGKVLYTRSAKEPPRISGAEAANFSAIYKTDKNGTISRIIYPYFEGSGAHRYSIIYDISSRQIDAQVQKETRGVVVFAIGALLITIVTTYLLINYFILRPVRKVSSQTALISGGNLEQQIETGGRDEIAQLGKAVNAMANSLKGNIAKLQELDKVKTEFMMIVSHNLRTPLTIISGYLENAETLKTVDQFRIALERIAISSKRLGVFAEDVLTISRFELGDAELKREVVDMTAFTRDIAEEFGHICEQEDREFTASIDQRARPVHLSRPHMRSALWNLLDNALKFTPKKGKISLAINDDGHAVHIVVSDTGIGISKEELPRLFTKFHRGTSTLTYDYEGTGIGLYASKIIVLHHGGEVTAASELGKGSTFTIILPLASSG